MKRNEEIGEIISDNPSVLCLFWSGNTGWEIVNSGNGNPVLNEESLKRDGIKNLRLTVMESDRELFDVFLLRLMESQDNGDADLESSNYVSASFHLKNSDDSYGYYKIECHLKRDESGKVEKIFARIPELDAEEIYRIHLAQTITNDKNPEFFTQGAKALMAKHPDWNYALVQFDVAKFKMINEQYGEAFGDEMLEFFIHTLKLLCDKEQLYARLTADVFMILTPFETKEDLLGFVESLRNRLLGYKEIEYRLVFGVCEVLDRAKELRKYGDGAAFARQSIKENALEHVAFYQKDMKENARMSKFIEDNMEKALVNHEFVMYLQPKYSISKDKVIGAEALVRWIHPDYGVVFPSEFVPIFEKNGFVIKMDQYIWEEACKTIRKWIDDGVDPLPISVNVSRRHLKDKSFVEVLNRLTEKYGIEKKYLEIEITETVEEKDFKGGVSLLKDNGYTLLMDDFGSGYSSLNTLKDTRFDVIKIDRMFLQDFIGSERGRKIVEHTIRMTRSIGLDLVAEGVETKEQALFLSGCGCDVAQGFYYAKPMTIEDFNKKYSGEARA